MFPVKFFSVKQIFLTITCFSLDLYFSQTNIYTANIYLFKFNYGNTWTCGKYVLETQLIKETPERRQ